jgi:hypothetical protein
VTRARHSARRSPAASSSPAVHLVNRPRGPQAFAESGSASDQGYFDGTKPSIELSDSNLVLLFIGDGRVNALHLLAYRTNLQVSRLLQKDIGKTFCIGFNKTGTTSLHRLFKTLGYRSYHGTRWHDLSNFTIYEQYDCFSDGFPLDWQMLNERYPGARFVLNVRDCKSWIFSRLQYIRRLKSIGRYVGGTSCHFMDRRLAFTPSRRTKLL